MSKGIEKLNKRYSGFIQMPGTYEMKKIQYVPTGSIALDFIIGKKWEKSGIPLGMVTLIWGKEGSGKSTLMASCLANALMVDDRMVALVDTELKVDYEYYQNIGIDFSRTVLVEPFEEKKVYGEQLVDAITELVRSGEYSIVACDSLANLEPKALIESESSENLPGVHSKLVSRLFSKVTEKAKRSNTAVILTSQRRANWGSRSFAGSSYNVVGGHRLKFNNCLQIKTTMVKRIKDGDEAVGIEVKVDLEKNTGIAYRTAMISITDGLGLDWAREITILGAPYGIAYKKGTWYYYTDSDTGEEVSMGQGERRAVRFLRSNPEIAGRLQQRVIDALEGEHGNKSD